MSFNLAFWMGPRPKSNAEAAAKFRELYDRHVERHIDVSPKAPELLAFLGEVTERYPDLTDLPDDLVDEGVWSDGPLVDDVTGPLLYLGIVWSRVEEVAPYLVDVGARAASWCSIRRAKSCSSSPSTRRALAPLRSDHKSMRVTS